MKRRRHDETDFKASVLGYLAIRGIEATRHQAGVVRVGRHWVHLGDTGWPDIVGHSENGLFVGIECKAGKGRLTEVQRARLSRMIEAGCLAGVARTLDDVEAILKGEGVIE